jgi:hypothetical protein
MKRISILNTDKEMYVLIGDGRSRRRKQTTPMSVAPALRPSRPGKTTARSVVRGFMRSKEATPFVVKVDCIQHNTVFIAKIRSAKCP